MATMDQPHPADHEVILGPVEDFAPGTLRFVHAGGRRLLVAMTPAGISVTDNACPHEGYGLVQGDIDGGVLTCAWHNWKYRLSDGHCIRGEEDLRLYPATVRDGMVTALVSDPDPEAVRGRLLGSLRRGLDDGYVGQMSRDVVRLLRVDADPVQLVWEAVQWGAPRAEFGFGHALASLVDLLHVASEAEGDLRALPIVSAFAGIAETERRRPLRPQPDPDRDLPSDPGPAFRALVEAEQLPEAEALLRGAIAAGFEAPELRRWLVGSVSDHHLGYGHPAIYVQKAFTLLEQLGWDRADAVLPHLVPAIGWSRREDHLPYMRSFTRALTEVDLAALASAEVAAGWAGSDDASRLRFTILGRDAKAVLERAGAAVLSGAGIEGLLDVVVGVASHRLAHYDPTAELTSDDTDFGWLDITHSLTYASAARWAWRHDPGPDTARLALWTAFHACYAGRRGYVEVGAEAADPVAPTVLPRPAALSRAALEDTSAGVPIICAHLVKTTSAAIVEAEATGDDAPLLAAARFVAAPRRVASVALNVRKAIDLADGKVPA
jgi:nitrite reductase/ring-hydroxylating ferredoxin subunit